MSYKSAQHLVDTTADRKSTIYDLTGKVLDGTSYTQNPVFEISPTQECYLKMDVSGMLDAAIPVTIDLRPVGYAPGPYSWPFSAGPTSGVILANTWVVKLYAIPYKLFLFMPNVSEAHTILEGAVVTTFL
jgi:hypothetical protein